MDSKNKKLTKLLTAGLLVALSPAVFADGEFYLGGGLGRLDSDTSPAGIDIGLMGATNQADSSRAIFAGYRFNSFLRVEGAYVDLGRNSVNTVFSEFDRRDQNNVNAWNVVGVGSWALTNRMSLFGKAGVARWKTKGNDTSKTSYLAFDEEGTKFTYGAGMTFDLNESAKIRAEWERYQIKPLETDLNVDYYTAGIVFSFK